MITIPHLCCIKWKTEKEKKKKKSFLIDHTFKTLLSFRKGLVSKISSKKKSDEHFIAEMSSKKQKRKTQRKRKWLTTQGKKIIIIRMGSTRKKKKNVFCFVFSIFSTTFLISKMRVGTLEFDIKWCLCSC